MTKKERNKIIKAINFFLDEDPDKWTDGIDELCMLVYGKKWSVDFEGCKSMSVLDWYNKQAKEG